MVDFFSVSSQFLISFFQVRSYRGWTRQYFLFPLTSRITVRSYSLFTTTLHFDRVHSSQICIELIVINYVPHTYMV